MEPQEYTDEDNITYVTFIKVFSPVLLHLAHEEHNHISKRLIEKFQNLGENVVPDREETNTLRTWVDSVQHKIDEMTPEDITRIMNDARLQKLDEDSFHKYDYELCNKKRPNRNCAITMEPIKPDEHYVDFLDNGNPYKVDAIIQYYKHMKETNLDRDDWKTPLRNKITEEDATKLDDLVQWYESNSTSRRRSVRTKRRRSNSKSPKSKGGKRTIKRRQQRKVQ